MVKGELPIVEVEDRAAWRAWLEQHHSTVPAIWLLFWKRHTGKQGLSYEDAVQEALCFGWIDSIVKALDVDRYLQKFTPRSNTASWSPTNRGRLRVMIAEGRMTEAGLAKVSQEVLSALEAPAAEEARPSAELPSGLEKVLRSERRAWKGFQRLSAAEKRRHVGWIMAAKRDETRRRRLAEVTGLLAEGRKLGLK